MRDIYHSNRGRFRRCRYWVRDTKKNIDPATYMLENNATGVFYAEETDGIRNTENTKGGTMLFDKNTTALRTEDDVPKIERGSIVEYLNEIWFVDNVQTVPHKKENEFSNHLHSTTYISIRK